MVSEIQLLIHFNGAFYNTFFLAFLKQIEIIDTLQDIGDELIHNQQSTVSSMDAGKENNR